MCGFLVAQSDIVSDRILFSKALELQSNRGPDAQNFYFDRWLAAGHVRLSIQDLSSLGDQPFLSECSNYLLVYNGEIFNSNHIAEKYCAGMRFKSKSDTEVLLYAIINCDCIQELLTDIEGFFSFVFYDKLGSKLIVARDSKGTKPLYYSKVNGKYIFSSETSSLRLLHSSQYVIDDDIDYASLRELCSTKYISPGNTSYSSIKEILSGEVLQLNLNSQVSHSLFFSQRESHHLSLIDAFQASVEARLLSDAPIASLLSGGIDSSLVTSAANSFKPIHAFTVSFPGFKHDESAYASYSQAHRMSTYTNSIPSYQLAEISEHLFQHIPYPLVDSSAFLFTSLVNISLYVVTKSF